MTTKWVDGINNELEETPTRETTARETTKSKWTGLVVEPITSIYDKVIKDIETEYETYAKSFSNTKEGFEYEIDNTPIYATRGPEDENTQEEEVIDETSPTKEAPPPSMNEDERSQLMTTIANIVIKVITVLATLFVTYNLYYNMKKTGKQIDFYSGLNFMSFGPFYVLTNAMLKTVKFFDDAMTDVIPSYLQKLIDYTTTFSDRTMFIMMSMIASIIVTYLKGEIARIYKFLFKNKMTWKSAYKFLFKEEGNKSVSGLHKAVFIYYYLFNNFSIWDPEAGITYNTGMIFFKSIGFLFWLIFVIVCFAAIFKPMLSFTTFIHFGIVFFYSMFCIPYDTKTWSLTNTINIMRSMSFDMNMNNVLFDPYTDNEYKQMFESGYKGLFKLLPYGVMIYAFAAVIPDIMKIGTDGVKWTMLSLAAASILGIGVSGIREYFIVNKIIKDVKNAIDDQIEDFKAIDWDGITADQSRLLQMLKRTSETNTMLNI
jgi:hypothetical protein